MYLPSIVSDLALCQYYAMACGTFIIALFYRERYSEADISKVCYSSEKLGDKNTIHIFSSIDTNNEEGEFS